MWRLYVDAVCAAAAAGIYDVMAHPDLAKVFGQVPPMAALLQGGFGDQLAHSFRAAGVCAISSAGLREEVRGVYPSDAWAVEAVRGAGIPITLASDAHLPPCGVGLGNRHLRRRRRRLQASLARLPGREREAVPLG